MATENLGMTMPKISYVTAPIIEVCMDPSSVLKALGFQHTLLNDLIDCHINDQGRVVLRIKCSGELKHDPIPKEWYK